MQLDFKLAEAFKGTSEGLDGVIEALTWPPPNPKTVVMYDGGTIEEYFIEGELGQNSIPDKANAVKVDIGTAVTSIGWGAFSSCSGLTSVTILDNVTSIGDLAFEGCSGLTSVTIPSGVTSIESNVFNNCSALTSITIPDGVTSIKKSAFYGCSSLPSITIPGSVTIIEEWAFYGCSRLTSVIIPNSVTSIGGRAFQSCSNLTSVTIGNSVTGIGGMAFRSCTSLSSITSLRTSAPTVQSDTFGSNSSSYTGYPTRGNNVLKVPQGATGYDASYWANPLQVASKCGFHIETI